MATQMQSHHDVLHATDTALRLVNQALGDLGTSANLASIAAPTAEKGVEGSGNLLSLASTLVFAYAEVTSLLERIKQSRGRLQEASDARLDEMNVLLTAVTSATELAASGMLDGLERAIVVVTELEQEADESQDLALRASDMLKSLVLAIRSALAGDAPPPPADYDSLQHSLRCGREAHHAQRADR